jgi:hypothetical protein
MLRLSKNNNPQHLVNRIQSGLRNYYYRLEDGKYCEDAALNERMHGASIMFLNGNIDELRAEMAQIFPILEEKHEHAHVLFSQVIPMFIYVYHGHDDALILEKKDFLIYRSNEIMLNIRRCGRVARSVIRNLYEPVLKYLSL